MGCVKTFVIAIVLASAVYGQVDVRALVKKSIENYNRDWRAGMAWTYTETDITHTDNTKTVDVSQVAPLDGTPYERLIMKNGRKLPPDEQRKEEQKYEKALKQREDESPSERAARIRKYESERAFIKEILEADNFKLLGQETVDGRPSYVIQLTPKPDYVPKSSHAAMLKHIEGKLWIDKQDVQWAKAEAHVIDTISIGWIVARVGPGARITLEQTRVNNNFWMPKRITINGNAKVFLVHSKDLNQQILYSDYRKASDAALASKQLKQGAARAASGEQARASRAFR
jgi:hypothetical protein